MIRGAAVENRHYYRGQAVEVRNTHNGRETWRPAKIHRTTSRGVEVIYAIGPQTPQHIMFPDVRPMEKAERPRPQVTRPLLTAEDIEAINARAEAEAREKKAAEAAKPPPPPASPTPPVTALALVPNDNVSPNRPRKPRKPREHHATPLSQYLRNARAAVSLQQRELAALTKITQWRIGDIELGDLDPSDDELIAMAGPLKLDLDHLLKLRELDDFETAPKTPTPPPPSAVVASAAPQAPTLVQLIRTPPAPAQAPASEVSAEDRQEWLRTIERLERERNDLLEECAVLRHAVVFYAGAMDQRS